MAEIQWVIEVRCVNTLLAKFMVGERGLHVCVHVPDRELDPHEFDVLVRGAEEAACIAEAHRDEAWAPVRLAEPVEPPDAGLGTVCQVERRGDMYTIRVLRTGEIAVVDIPGAVLGPSEMDRFIDEMKAVQRTLAGR